MFVRQERGKLGSVRCSHLTQELIQTFYNDY
ncbi:hypothetical protein BN11_4780004 [Nostocoides australiense Ben110]|uniref:Uncharacterized protein n=1 Tax=Nostocoides australiense Ben110 TaxID=1193182 RepID=W6K104_9MICO|nr:hypothetical protein BN11_4780004 [Tetrasphaera australiensis Ben110]